MVINKVSEGTAMHYHRLNWSHFFFFFFLTDISVFGHNLTLLYAYGMYWKYNGQLCV